jgi:hypothetical protein
MPFLAGLVALFVVPAVVFAAALGAARLTSRHVGLPAFRPFADPPPGATGRRFVVRSASVAAAFDRVAAPQ